MKTALILEGGGMRGLYTAGALDILMENNIETHIVSGVSAGALFGINYKSKQPGRVLRYNLKYADNSENLGIKHFLKTGDLMSEQFYFVDLPFKLDVMDTETYRTNKTEFHAVVTNLLTGQPEYKSIFDLENHECMEYLRASGSLPFVSKPVFINGVPYLDGGVSDSIPVKHYIDEGYDKIIVILTKHHCIKSKGKIHGSDIVYKKYPEFAKVLKNRNTEYINQYNYVKKLEKDGRIIVIQPSEYFKVRTTEKNRDVIRKLYELGVKDCKNKIRELLNYLEECNEQQKNL